MDRAAAKLKKVAKRAIGEASRSINVEASNLARFSDGASACSLGDTSVLVTAVARKSSPSSFAPLSVDYRQKAAASGRIPMTHLRRDIGVTEHETLTSRMIDRSIRPAFRKGFNYETQIICNILAVDGSNDPDVLAINGASASLALSDIPWSGPIGATRVGLVGESLIANPTRKERENCRLNLVLAANRIGNLMMMDGSCLEPVLMPDLLKAIKFGVKECQSVVEQISRLQKSNGKPKRVLDLKHMPNTEHIEHMKQFAQSELREILMNYNHDKTSRDRAMEELREKISAPFMDKFPALEQHTFLEAFVELFRITYKSILTETRLRCDGRHLDQLRPISAKVDLYRPLHGSAIFQRGLTQVFCSTTFDSPDAAIRTDSLSGLLSGIKEKNFMLHYEFPSYATNEVGKPKGALPGRREIGHGALAEKSIRPLMPDNHDMTIRLNCEVMMSNGSSSMASVCAGSMSLMDAGVDIKEHVAGVAMGLVSNLGDESNEIDKDSYFVLTDILGLEDYFGDMDFKIAGTKKAVTALQLDVKPTQGVTVSIVNEAIQQAHVARGEIINKMNKVIREPRKEKKENHPVMKTIYIPAHKKAKFIGFGGSNIKKLTAQIGVKVSSCESEETHDGAAVTAGDTAKGNFILFAPNKDAMAEAEEFIKTLLEETYKAPELEFNGIYTAIIEEIRPNGVMVTLQPGTEPTLLPISQLDIRPIKHPSALNLQVGQQIQVKYFGRDPSTGQMRISRKSLLMSSVAKVHRTPMP